MVMKGVMSSGMKMGNKSHRRLRPKRFQVAPKEEIQGIEIRELWRPRNKFDTSNPPPEICSMEVVTHHNRKMCWGTIMNETGVLGRSDRYFCSNSGRSGKFAYMQVSSTQPRRSKSLHFFDHFPRMAYRPPDGYYYRNFHRLNVVSNSMFYRDLSPPCCLLSTLNLLVVFGYTLYILPTQLYTLMSIN
ncbi:hypothetical protein TNCV_3819131 [Trichonephila clavipes]|nr:hypothetical protein TNCV_3819131 [Trichonephila clavipes]